MKFALLVILPLYLLDQITKWLVVLNMDYLHSIPVVPGLFNLVHVRNTGAAFGMGSGNNLFFIVLSLSVGAFLMWMGWKNKLPGRMNHWAAALLGTGILGNVTDRLIHGHVIDFLDFYRGDWHWPAFNVADMCICTAAALFFIAGWKTPAPGPVADNTPS